MTRLFDQLIESGEQLEVITRSDFESVAGDPSKTFRRPAGSEITEWEALLDAIEEATGRLTMLELGAGYGRWTVTAAAALRRYRPELKYRFIALEAEPTHYHWLKQHTRDNGLRRWSRDGNCNVMKVAVSARTGRERFFIGNPRDWYGQTLVRPENETADAPIAKVRTVTLSRLLRRLDRVDLIDIDIQGAELEVLTEAAPALGRVRRIHVETHFDEIDERLPGVFERAAGNWQQEIAIPLGAVRTTRLGDQADYSGGGVQLWRNGG